MKKDNYKKYMMARRQYTYVEFYAIKGVDLDVAYKQDVDSKDRFMVMNDAQQSYFSLQWGLLFSSVFVLTMHGISLPMQFDFDLVTQISLSSGGKIGHSSCANPKYQNSQKD